MSKLNFNGGSSFAGDQTGNWSSRVASLVAEKCIFKSKDPTRPTSNRTQITAYDKVQTLFSWLRQKLGFSGLSNPYSIDERHLVALAGHITAKKEKGEIGSAMAAGYATYCRHLARWIGKPELVQVFNLALGKDVCKRALAAERDKSWEAAGVDLDEKIIEVMHQERWVALVLWCQRHFGMRKTEALMFQPYNDIMPVPSIDMSVLDRAVRRKKQDMKKLHWKEWAGGITVSIIRGTKGKRPRHLHISPENQDAIEFAYELLQEMEAYGDRETLGPTFYTLKQNAGTYDRVLKKFGITQKDLGITGHGLRAGFACDMLESYDIKPTVRGGNGRHEDPVVQAMAYKATTEALGHGRTNVVSAYAGGFTPEAAARLKKSQERRALLTAQAQGPSAAEEMVGLVEQWGDKRTKGFVTPSGASLVTQRDSGIVTRTTAPAPLSGSSSKTHLSISVGAQK